MKDNEYNVFTENNQIKENVFSKEVYNKYLGHEIRPSNDEIHKTTEFHNYKDTSSPKSTNPLKKVIQKVMESVNSFSTAIAGTAVVAITSIVLFANVVISKPDFDILKLVEGYDSVEYTIMASELDENTDYFVSIENSKESYQYDLIEGENYNFIKNLENNAVYNLSIIGKNDENNTEVTYLTQRFFTLKDVNATYEVINEEDVIIHWDNPDYYKVEFNTNFNNMNDENLLYRIIINDINSSESFIYEGTDPVAFIEVPTSIYEVSVSYEFIRITNDEEHIYEKIDLDENLIFNIPTIEFKDLVLSDVDQYEMTIIPHSEFINEEVYNNIILNLTFSDATIDQIIIDDLIINQENVVTIDVPPATNKIIVDYEWNLLGKNGHNPRTVIGSNSYDLTNEYKLVSTVVDTKNYNRVEFEFIYHFINEETSISAYNLSDQVPYVLSTWNNKINCYIDTNNSTGEFVYYLSNLDGEKIGTETNITVDIFGSFREYLSAYTFNYKNPTDVLITYNDDGTINLYIDTSFTTEDDQIYYGIEYSGIDGSEEIYYTDAIAKYENVPIDDYAIVYRIYRKINGEIYVLDEIAVSGTTSILYYLTIENSIVMENNQLTFKLENYLYVFDENSFVFTLDGVDYKVETNQVVYDDANKVYIISHTFKEIPTEYSLRFSGNIKYHNEFFDSISNKTQIKGNEYTTINVTS